MTEQISVLLPMVRDSKWLGETVASLVAQTHEDWLLIAVLDGDCEQNRAILAHPALAGRVRIDVMQERSGVATALNKGLASARTQFVARLDADDICEPHRLERQLEVMKSRRDLQVLGSAATLIDEDGAPIGMRTPPVGAKRLRRRLLWRNSLIHPSTMLRRDAVEKVGGYNTLVERAQDYDLWLRLSSHGPLDNVPEPLLRYRIHGDQHSRPITGRAESNIIKHARRKAASSAWGASVLADARHHVWFSYQHLQAWRRRRAAS